MVGSFQFGTAPKTHRLSHTRESLRVDEATSSPKIIHWMPFEPVKIGTSDFPLPCSAESATLYSSNVDLREESFETTAYSGIERDCGPPASTDRIDVASPSGHHS